MSRVAIRSAFALLMISMTLVAIPAPRVRALEQPNIVVIVTDDQRDGTLRWMPIVEKRLVAAGMNFKNAAIPDSVCCPSRSTILTGLNAHSTGVWSNGGGPQLGGWEAFHGNGMERRTIATMLDPTYRTMLVGKYLNGYDRSPPGYIPPGWNVWHAFRDANAAYYDYDLIHTNGTLTHYGHDPADYSTDVLARYAVSEIHGTPDDRPLFLYFTPYAPHGPSTPAPRHANLHPGLKKYRPPSFNERDLSDKPPWIRALSPVDPSKLEERRLAQYRTLQSMDDAVGAILDALREEGRVHNTLVLFISDNGGSWGEHRVDPGEKFLPYAFSTRVPLVMRWDGVVPAGSDDARIALNVDLAATIADAAGLAPPRTEGHSLLDRWRRGGTVIEASANPGKGGNGLSIPRPAYCGYLTKRYLFVRYGSGHRELYDYAKDPWELKNVAKAAGYADVVARLRDKAQRECVPTPPGFSW